MTREELLGTRRLRTRDVHLPDSGLTVRVRTLPLRQAVQFENIEDYAQRSIFATVHGVVDDDGAPVFTAEDTTQIEERFPPSDLIQIHNAVTELTALVTAKKEVENDAKN